MTPERSMRWAVSSMVDELQSVLVGRPAEELAGADPHVWHYERQVDLEQARREHDAFVKILKDLGVSVHVSTRSGSSADAMFVHDPILVTARGSLGLRPGKVLRRGEVEAGLSTLDDLGIPRVGKIEHGTCEGGDLLWLNDNTVLAGIGYRTNLEGVEELRALLAPSGVQVETYDLPVFQGRDACLHLQSLVSLVDRDLAVVHSALMPVRLKQRLEEAGIELLEAPADEFATQATNILCVRPRVVVMLTVNRQTRELLEQRGCEVYGYSGDELSLATEGGATCLTRPILRASSEVPET